ncbi:hypothetical protein Glove_15g26 [Diversispora epigaea]|uniref:Uncharacterized protein n=1 Tax=Diversispora epigaea TaxID=1348612 RepID=A0A397JLZ7_9GLOM|nr:hypothetical protein Glove_15g26 [Diversispora epigaea]
MNLMNVINMKLELQKVKRKHFNFTLNQLKEEIGYCYQHGIGTTKDEVKAFQWYLKSAKGGNHMEQNNRVNCYHDGIGTLKDEEKAFQSYIKSAEGVNSNGQEGHNLKPFENIITTWNEIGRPQIHGYDIHCLSFVDQWKYVSFSLLEVTEVRVNNLQQLLQMFAGFGMGKIVETIETEYKEEIDN